MCAAKIVEGVPEKGKPECDSSLRRFSRNAESCCLSIYFVWRFDYLLRFKRGDGFGTASPTGELTSCAIGADLAERAK